MPHEMDDLDRVLSANDTLVPSSGFAARVMDAVRDDVEEQPPLAFPWRPFLIGVMACLVWAGSAIRLMTGLDGGVFTDMAAEFAGAGPASFYVAAFALTTLLLAVGLQRLSIRR